MGNLVAKKCCYSTISSLDSKITENEWKKLKTFDLDYFIGKNYFEEDGAQNYLAFQPIIKYFKVNTIINAADCILSW